jgi:hypothetical protein
LLYGSLTCSDGDGHEIKNNFVLRNVMNLLNMVILNLENFSGYLRLLSLRALGLQHLHVECQALNGYV